MVESVRERDNPWRGSLAPVSVVIPCYRCRRELPRALDSVARQRQRPVEVILVDDHSADGTLATIEQLAQHYGPDWVRVKALAENQGPAAARNAGWELARQPYIAFLDADDAWHPDKIRIQYNWMREHPEVVLSGHACLELRPGESPPALAGTWSARTLTRRAFLLSNQFSPPSAMIRRDLGYRFAAGWRYAEDYLLWLEIVFDGLPVAYLDLPLAYYFKPPYGHSGLSSDLWAMERGELAVFWCLAAAGRLGRGPALLLSSYSLLKYFRRLLQRGLARVQPASARDQ